MKHPHVFQFIILLLVAAPSTALATGETEDSATLRRVNDYLRTAALNNAGLKASYQAWQGALAEVPQAKTWDDPRLDYTYYISEIETRVGPQKGKLSLVQSFPRFGEIEARTDAAAAAAKAARRKFETEKLKLFAEVKKNVYEYGYLGRAIAITGDNLELIAHFEEVARIKYQTAEASHPDIIRAQIELAKLDDRLEALRELRQPLTARLNALLNRPPDRHLPWPDAEQTDAFSLDRREMVQKITESNPELAALDWDIQAAKKRIEWAKTQYYPEIALGLNWIQVDDAVMPNVSDSGNDAVGVALSLNIPLGRSRYEAIEQQNRAAWHQTREQKTQRQNDLVSRAFRLLYDIEDDRRKMQLYGDNLIGRAGELVQASEAAYRAGTIDFLSLIDAQRTLLRYSLEYERAKTDYRQKIAGLEMLIGGEL